MPVSKEVLDEVALSESEYQLIVQKLGREPSAVELGLFGSLWSEHCGYKHSKLLLKLFPTKSRRVLVEPGEENAGAVDIGDGLAVVMKMESHNHPSAIEPFQGAATGVGGIVRDIFTMGARPIALLNSLRFGPLKEPRNRYLFNGVVGGIAAYGNCLGIPDVGGEICFSPAYSDNPLVNAMCVGIVRSDRLVKARAGGAGNLLMLVGADTGRDGLHGASGLASRTFEEQKELRSAVQVGNPFLEKLLIEACLELAETDWIVGVQDLGAAGLTSASVECASRTGSGIDLDTAKVPRREEGMNSYEVMLSESQERMLVVVKKGYESKVKSLFDRWDLHSDIIGQVTDDGVARIREGGTIVAEVPVQQLMEPPMYRVATRKPGWLSKLQGFDLSTIPDLAPEKCQPILLKLLDSSNIASKEWIYRQYDHQVQTNTVVPPGGDAAVLRLKDTRKAISLTTDGNGRYCYLDPYHGGAMAVAEAARNLVCTGAEPLAVTDCLNMGNPERPDIYYQLKECIRGMAAACRRLNTPVISGNVSLYNETKGRAVYPTPVVGMVGLIEDIDRYCTSGFKDEGDVVFLLGSVDEGGLAGSEYLELIHGLVSGRPIIDLDQEKRVQHCCLSLIRKGVVKSAHDCSDGGLAIALAECCIMGSVGFRGGWPIKGRLDEALFGEAPSRIVVSVSSNKVADVKKMAARHGVKLTKLGVVGGRKIIIEGLVDLPLDDIGTAWRHGLERALRGSP
ncbi:MAG: phosphoribosylformylglycinamidine synthase II [Chloroflexi bacterium RBG_13_53_26]|nr:MAG: phosphoribosylformylglycinamidine synthase II [Chloroflexi bacterium RBG_13_53_26]